MIGQRLAHYRITERIGEGGMGTVYKADDLTLKRTVAIKVIRPSHQDPDVANKRFLREAQAISQIDHPNVITVLEIIQKGSANFLVMQYVPGSSLRDRLAGRPVEPAEACRIAAEIAAGLEAAHEVGVVHRDIKPENVIIEPAGRAKVLDFGVARLIDRSTLTRKGRIVGTLPYMAPEQIKGDVVDPRTDTYSLGVVLFEMLTGSVPFTSREEAALFYQILNTDPAPLETLVPDLPEGLEAILAKALAKDPDKRYQSAAQMHHDLDIVHRRFQANSVESQRLFAKSKKRHRVGASIGAAIFIMVAVMFWRTFGPGLIGEKAPPRIMVTRASNSLGDANLEYLSGGIMDCLIARLGRLEGYNVISRQTMVTTEGALNLRAAGLSARGDLFGAAEQVGADYLITGSYAESGGVIRINCELNEVKKGVLLDSWSDDLMDLEGEFFSSIDQFAGHIASALGAAWKRDPVSSEDEDVALTQSLEALKYYQKGVEASETGNIPEVLENMRKAIEHDTRFTAAYLWLSRSSPDGDEKRSSLEMAMKYRYRAPPAFQTLVAAEFYVFNDQIDEAINAYETVLAENPEQVQARSALASLLIRKRRFDDAIAEFAVAKTINPFDYSYYPQWWVAYFEVGREDKALAVLEEWRRQMDQEPGPLYQLITLNGVLGRWNTYMALCDTLAQISPAAVQHRGYGLILLGRLDEAEEVFDRVVANPDEFYAGGRGLTYLSEVSYHRRDYSRGLELIQRALETSKDFYNCWMAGRLAAGCGEDTLANEYAKEIAALFSASTDDSTTVEAFAFRRFYYHLMGEIALWGGDVPQAVSMFENSLRFSMRVDALFFRTCMGRAWLEAGNLERAVDEFEQVLKINPHYPEALLYLGKARLALGEGRQAKKVLNRLGTIWEDADKDYPLKLELDSMLEKLDRG